MNTTLNILTTYKKVFNKVFNKVLNKVFKGGKILKNEDTTVRFLCSLNLIEIPAEFREFVIRVNFGKYSPQTFSECKLGTQTVYEWPENGSVFLNGGSRGLFAVRLSQPMILIKNYAERKFQINYVILEIDKRLIEDCSNPFIPVEVEFRQCNVFYNGGLQGFLERMKNIATEYQYLKICSALRSKILEHHIENLKPLSDNDMLKKLAENQKRLDFLRAQLILEAE